MQQTPFPEKKWSKEAFAKIKKLSKGDYLRLLRRDPNWVEVKGTTFFNENLEPPSNFVSIHYHKAKETFTNTRLIRNLLNQTCWTEELLKEWRAI